MHAALKRYQMPPVRQTLRIPGVSDDSLRAVRERFPESAEAIISRASELLDWQPPAITDKTFLPPSGDKRDFVSLSIYFWPDPSKPDGLPYIPHDGKPNPELENYDHAPMTAMACGVDHLVMAWQITENPAFAQAAARWLRRWFLDSATGMNPNMNWAQFVPGEGLEGTPGPGGYPFRYIADPITGKGLCTSFGGAIEACNLVTIPELAQALAASGFWTNEDQKQLQNWFSRFLTWLFESVPGNDEQQCRNNHASWFCAYAGAAADYCGDTWRARELFGTFCPQRLLSQIEPDGSQPEELYRTVSFNYTVFTLYAFCNAAFMAEARGIDLWNHPSPGGSRLRRGIDFILPVVLENKPWTYRQDKPIEYHTVAYVLAAAYRAWGDESYREAARLALTRETETNPVRHIHQALYAI